MKAIHVFCFLALPAMSFADDLSLVDTLKNADLESDFGARAHLFHSLISKEKYSGTALQNESLRQRIRIMKRSEIAASFGHAPTSSSCRVDLLANVIEKQGIRFCNPIGNAQSDQACFHHLSVVTTPEVGEAFYFRGGPSTNNPLNFGAIRTEYGAYKEGSVDYQAVPDARIAVGNIIDPGCRETNQRLRRYSREVNAASVPYIPPGQTSNSVVAGAITSALEMQFPQIPMSAPGSGNPIDPASL